MIRLAISLLATCSVAVAGAAFAQSSGNYPAGDYAQDGYPPQADAYRYGDVGGTQYDYARVVRVDPVIVSGYGNDDYAASQQRCYSRQGGDYADADSYDNDGYGRGDDDGYRDDRDYANGSETGRNVATVVGGVVGAVLGSKVGGGSARYATAAVGSMVGGMAGRQVYESNHRYRQPRSGVVTVCDPVPGDGPGYRVDTSRVAAYDVTYEYAGRRYTTRTDYHPGDTIRVRVDVRPE